MRHWQATCALLARTARAYSPVALASSLQAEDMVLTDLIARHDLEIEIFMLDTGRLHGDTLALLERIRRHYGLEVRVFSPNGDAVEEYTARHGRDAFYASVELRKRCCQIRKVEPLARALAGRKAWITGLRREQSAFRSEISFEEWDEKHQMKKFNPLVDWSEDEVWAYLRRYDVPYNALYDQGYRSIGCAPCTRPVVAGEDARAGRWWWEHGTAAECGIHFAPDRKVIRVRQVA
ncbi:MAG: phosphoadenylyl-sulfate reductase [Pseudomonadota bacterium]